MAFYIEIKMSTVETKVVVTKKEEMSNEDVHLIQWEELALSIEEHYHAQELFSRQPNGVPMGHR
mgnify:CR=1 FL=1|tara:strand:+ start:525 stop:716 length:192 start_codon:yes stop_codon:yes gene_type:complete